MSLEHSGEILLDTTSILFTLFGQLIGLPYPAFFDPAEQGKWSSGGRVFVAVTPWAQSLTTLQRDPERERREPEVG